MSGSSLLEYFKIVRALKKHNYSIDEIESITPFERMVYMKLIEGEIKAEEARRQKEATQY